MSVDGEKFGLPTPRAETWQLLMDVRFSFMIVRRALISSVRGDVDAVLKAIKELDEIDTRLGENMDKMIGWKADNEQR